jgi:hypothetical protein
LLADVQYDRGILIDQALCLLRPNSFDVLGQCCGRPNVSRRGHVALAAIRQHRLEILEEEGVLAPPSLLDDRLDRCQTAIAEPPTVGRMSSSRIGCESGLPTRS